MTDRTSPESQDWYVPGILVAVVIVLAVTIGIVVGVRGQGHNDESVTAQLARWSSCLRSEGANVPLVEPLRDGGFRVTVEGSLLSDGLESDSIGPALDACSDDVPERITKIVSALDDLSWLSFSARDHRVSKFGEERGIPFDTFKKDPRRSGRDLNDIAKLCERVEIGEIDNSNLHPRLLKSCMRSK
jgi:hypothetical protein